MFSSETWFFFKSCSCQRSLYKSDVWITREEEEEDQRYQMLSWRRSSLIVCQLDFCLRPMEKWWWATQVKKQTSEEESNPSCWRYAGVMLVCGSLLLTWVLLAARVQSHSWRPCTGKRAQVWDIRKLHQEPLFFVDLEQIGFIISIKGTVCPLVLNSRVRCFK